MAGKTKLKGCWGTGILHRKPGRRSGRPCLRPANMCYVWQAVWQSSVVGGDVAIYQRMIRSTFKDELSRKSVLSYLAPIVKQQGEAYGLIAMTQVQVSDLSVVTTFIWPDYETAIAAWDEYGGKVTEAISNSGAKVEVQEGLVERAWFN